MRGEDTEPTIGGLFARLADNSTDLVRAEVELYRATALHRISESTPAIVGFGIALMLVQAALVSLLVMLAIAAATRIGPVSAGFLVFVVTIIVAAVVAVLSARRLQIVAEKQGDRQVENPEDTEQ